MRILQLYKMILHDERKKSSYSFLRSLVKGQDHSFFKVLTGVFCTVGGTLVSQSFDRVIIDHRLGRLIFCQGWAEYWFLLVGLYKVHLAYRVVNA
jgi:hypothetical protein